jgi:hypothetical protein
MDLIVLFFIIIIIIIIIIELPKLVGVLAEIQRNILIPSLSSLHPSHAFVSSPPSSVKTAN